MPAQTQSVSYAEQWGIYSSVSGNPLYTPVDGGTLSFFSLAYSRRMQISDFPIEANTSSEGAAFASFNKVWQPANPIVTFSLSGSETEQYGFLSALDAACASTDLYDVITPEASLPRLQHRELFVSAYGPARRHDAYGRDIAQRNSAGVAGIWPDISGIAHKCAAISQRAPPVNSGLIDAAISRHLSLGNLLSQILNPLGVN